MSTNLVTKIIQIMPADNWWAKCIRENEGNKNDIWHEKVAYFALTEWHEKAFPNDKHRSVHSYVATDYGFEEVDDLEQFHELVFSKKTPVDIFYFDGDGNPVILNKDD